MSDIKLFDTSNNQVSELSGGAMALEKSLQTLFENNLEVLLGVRFLKSEFVTNDGGRMDSIGIDENNSPVIIEYKRSSNENVINQGLFYLNWLMGHKKDFEWMVLEKYGEKVAKLVDWSGPRLVCIANDFTKYDEHAVKQMDRNIDLIRYKKFDGDLLLLEQLTSITAKISTSAPIKKANDSKIKYKTISDYMAVASPEMMDRYHAIEDFILSLGDDAQKKTTDFYIAFRRIKNFACVELRNNLNKIIIYVRVNPDDIELEDGFTRDMRNIGHYGTGDLEINILSNNDFEKAKPLIEKSFINA